jgi:hypothetical protein
MTLEQWGVLVGIVVTVGGSLFGVYKWRYEQKAKLPNLAVTLKWGYHTLGTDLVPPSMLFLEVANKGDRAVKVIAVELVFRGNTIAFTSGIKGTDGIPFQLEPWKDARFWIPTRNVQLALFNKGYRGNVNIRARFRDAIGNRFDSRNFQIHTTKNFEQV